jgi:uncharacterized membrane protein (UPF0127 family)
MTWWRPLVLVIAVGGLGVFLAVVVAWWSSAERVRDVHVGGAVMQARVADTMSEWRRGLSGTSAEAPLAERSMVFFFPTAEVREFWMVDMNYPLDVYWFAGDTLVGASLHVPAPQGAEPPATMRSPKSANIVLEVPAGTSVPFSP